MHFTAHLVLGAKLRHICSVWPLNFARRTILNNKKIRTKRCGLLIPFVVFLLDVRIKATKKLAHYKYELLFSLW